jgi:dipeptidyl aminopeptidase/acylaminoacyl peptidase
VPCTAPCLVATVASILVRASCGADGAVGSHRDWGALVRDPAARVEWIDARTLRLHPVGEGLAVTEVDVATGTVRAPGTGVAEAPSAAGTRSPSGADRGGGTPPARPVAEPPLPDAVRALAGPHLWSPDRAHVIAWEVVPGDRRLVTLVESAPRDQLQPKVRTIEYLKPGDRIEQRWPRLFAADGTERALDRALFANPWAIDECRWSADGRTFFFRYNQRGHQVLRLCAVDAASGSVRSVVSEESATFVDYAHKGWMHWLSEGELLWMSERDGWNHVLRVDVPTGEAFPVTRGPWVVREVEHVDAAARTLRLCVMGIDPAQDPYHRHVVRVPIDGGEPVRLTVGDGTHRLEWSPDGAHYVDTWSRVDHPPVHELRRASDGGLVRELGRADASALVAAGWTVPERVVAKGRDGATDVWGVVWRPCGTAGDPTPRAVVEQVYAGPQDFFVPKEWSAWQHVRDLTHEGFVVVQVDGMGTNWRGKRFHDVCWKNLRDSGLPDHVSWLRAAAVTRPWMDLTRVGIYGGSAGGQSAMRALLDHPDVYSVAVADCGCHDNRMDKIWWNELWMGWPVDESYERCSNVVDAPMLRGTLMLVVGELDDNVDPASTLQVSAALVRGGKDHELVVIPGAGHGAAETPFGSMKRREFLKRHLLAAP